MYRNWRFNNLSLKDFETDNGGVIISNVKTAYLRNFKIQGNSIRDGVPSPEDNKPITSVESPLLITIAGRNLWRNNVSFPISAGASFTLNYDEQTQIYTANGTFGASTEWKLFNGAFCPVKTGDKVTIYIEHISGARTGGNPILAGYYAETSPYAWLGHAVIPTSGTVRAVDTAVNDGMSYAILRQTASTTYDNYKFKVSWYLGDVDYGILPYKGTTITVPIKDTENNTYDLHKVVDTQFNVEHYDEIDLDKGVLYKRIAKTTLRANEAEDWRYIGSRSSGGRNTYLFEARGIKLNNPRWYEVLTFNNTFPDLDYNYINYYASEGISSWYGANATLRLGINQDRIDGLLVPEAPPLAKFETWLSDNNIELLYVMRTPETKPLHADTINALRTLTAFDDGINNIMATSASIAPRLTFKAASGGK